jgi:hypothetical protein
VSDNPYQQQTNQNTSTNWLDDQTPVDLNLDGMGEFAKHVVTIGENLGSHSGRLDLLASLPSQAWEGGALPEGIYSMKEMLRNYTELQQYVNYLQIALKNIGMAAQTIADAYSSTDGWSAASLDAVNFAFGDPNVKPPAGLPPWVTGKTYWDAYFESQAQGQQSGATANTQWKDDGQRVNPDGSVTQRSVAPDGRAMEITTFNVPMGGGSVVTTSVIGTDGKVLSSTSQRSNSYLDGNSVITRTTSYDADGHPTGSKSKTVTYGDHGQVQAEGTTSYDKDGKQTASTQTTTDSDGSQTITTKSADKVTREVHVGTQTDGISGMGDAPAKDAIENFRPAH